MKIEEISEKMKYLLPEDNKKSDDEFYIFEKLDGMKNKSYDIMARKFLNLRFNRSHHFKSRPKSKPFNSKDKIPK